MKKFRLVGILCAAVLFTALGCENFLSGSEIKEELQKSINEANAAEVQIFISADADTGSVAPNGTVTYKVGKSFPVVFTEAKGYKFKYWEVLDRTTKEVINGPITVSDALSPEIQVTINSNVANLLLHPVCVERPNVSNYAPQYADAGVPRDSSIVITFSKNISADNDFSRIQITSGGNSVKNCYKAPVVNNNILTIAADPANLLEVSSSTKTINVTVPSDFFYVDGNSVVSIGSEFSWSFKVNSTTDAKSEISFSVSEDAGKITPEGLSQKFNIGETINLKFEPKAGYSFKSWKALDGEGKEVSNDILRFADKNELSTTVTILGQVSAVSITPDCVQVPMVTSFTPKQSIDGVLCYSSILINFNIPMNQEDLHDTFNKISISNSSGLLINDYFYNPVLSDDGKTLRIRPKEDKITDLLKAESLCAISVTLQDGINSSAKNGYTLASQTYTYTINKRSVDSNPSISKLTLARDLEGADKIIQTESLPSEWSSEMFEANHTLDYIYISGEALASSNPVSSIVVTETFVQDNKGANVSAAYLVPKTTEISNIETSQIDDNTYVVKPVKYTMQSGNDGVAKLRIQFKDVEGHLSSNYVDYCVITDVTFEIKAKLLFGEIISTDETTALPNCTRLPDAEGYDNLPINKITQLTKQIYNNVYLPLNVTIQSRDDGEQTQVAYSQKNFSDDAGIIDLSLLKIKRNAHKTTFIDLVVSDDSGRSSTISYCIPRSVGIGAVYTTGGSYLYFYAKDIADPQYDKYMNAYVFYREKGSDEDFKQGTFVFSRVNNNFVDVKSIANSNFTAGKTYEFGISYFIRDNSQYRQYGCLGDLVTIKYLGDNKFDKPNMSVVFPTNSATVEKSIETNLLKCSLVHDFDQSTDGVYYQPYLKYNDGSSNRIVYIDNPNEFYVTPGYSYDLYYTAIDPVTGLRLTNSDSSIMTTISSGTNNPSVSPIFDPTTSKLTGKSKGQVNPNTIVLLVNSDSINVNNGTAIDSKLHYYVEENSPANKFNQVAVTSEIEAKVNASKDYVTINTSIPTAPLYDTYYVKLDLPGALSYSTFGKLSNESGKYDIKGIGNFVSEVSSAKKWDFEAYNNNNSYTDRIVLKNTKGLNICLSSVQVYGEDATDWEFSANIGSPYPSTTSQDGKIDMSTVKGYVDDVGTKASVAKNFLRIDSYCRVYDSSAHVEREKYYYKALYIHTDYLSASAKKCTNKNMLEGNNGYQIFTDKPALIQVLYTKGNYGTDADMWATKALEADVQYITGNSTYKITDDILNRIPDGCNYCTVVHFVDGDTAMSSIKTK